MSVEGVEILNLDEIEIGFAGTIKQAYDLRVSNRRTLRFAHKAGAPVIGTECFLKTVGVDLGAAIRKGEHFEAIAIERIEFFAKSNGVSIFGIEEDINADEFFLLRRYCYLIYEQYLFLHEWKYDVFIFLSQSALL